MQTEVVSDDFSLNTTASQLTPGEGDRMAGIARVLRRICLLREQGDAAEAQRLRETELGNAVRDFRLKHGAESLSESELRALEQREEQRIADAVVLAELLIPQLVAARTMAAPAPARREPDRHPAAAVISFPDNVSVAPRAPASGSPAIPDLLDAMLAAERNGRRATADQRQ
jgi:hypothetical protein